MSTSPIAIARALHSALEEGLSGEALRHLFAEDAHTLEHPNPIRPRGARSSLEEILAGSVAGAKLLSEQRYTVHSALESGSLAVLRLTWSGTVARDAGPFRAGQVLTAHIAQFIETREGRISSIETYDCYEPFA